MLNISVRNWMTTPVIAVSPSTPISEAHQMMKDKKVRRLVVLDKNKIVGMITIGDVREASPSDAVSLSIWELNYLWAQLTVERIMTRNIVTIKPDDNISKAARLMLEKKISGLPVVNDAGELIGMITESDVFRMLVNTFDAVPATEQPS